MTDKNKQCAACNAVLGERDYQDRRWADAPSKGVHDTAGYITFMQHYVTVAAQQITKSEDDTAALDTIRKIAALGVACMEQNGVVHRKE